MPELRQGAARARDAKAKAAGKPYGGRDPKERRRNAPYTGSGTDVGSWRVEDAGALIEQAVEGLFDHGIDEFIVSVHRLKTVMAAREELRADPPAEVADLITAGLNRFLHARLKRKQVRRNVYQAMKFVARDG